MAHHLAQINIARFILPAEDPANADFINNLDRVNAIAEQAPGFVWRLTSEAADDNTVIPLGDPRVIANMSVWENLDALVSFVYKDPAHKELMRRRKEWFEKMEFYLALWWIEPGHVPTLEEASKRLQLLRDKGPGPEAFTFASPFDADGNSLRHITDKCA